MTTSSFLQGDLASFRKAVATNNKESIEKHLSHMKNISQADLNQALFTCIDNFRIDEQTDECLFLLLRNKSNPNCQINGQTPLIAACKTAQITLVKNLIENGAKADLCNSEGKHPLQFILSSRKENYDVAQYLISMMGSVNIEVGKDSALVVAVQKEFFRIFKMLVEKGASLTLNDETILHVITLKKFRDSNKKKRFLKELANRWQLALVRDRQEKVPLDYETDHDMRSYYQQIFKPKVKPIEKEHHPRNKEKESLSPNTTAKDKQKEQRDKEKKRQKEEQQKIVNEEDAVEDDYNEEEGLSPQPNEQLKEKIVEALEEEEEERKADDEKQKIKKNNSKVLNSTATLNKKILKPALKNPIEKQPTADKALITEKERSKKVVNDKKKKQPQPNNKKNKSFSGLLKKVEVQQDKKDEDKKKLSGRSSFREEDSKKICRKGSDLKLEKTLRRGWEEEGEPEGKTLPAPEVKQIEDMLGIMVEAVGQIFQKVQEALKEETSSQSSLEENYGYPVEERYDSSLESELNSEIIECLSVQEEIYNDAQPRISEVITYLENKMKLCLESHVQHEFSLKMGVYGSQATALSIFQSDLDLLVMTSQNPSELIRMFDTFEIFMEEEIKEVKFIKGASMPVIKLLMSEQLYSYKVDITFQLREHTGLRCAQLIEQFKAAEPLLKPLVIVLKQIIYAYQLADPYTGGLGSYSLTLMVIALLQLTQSPKTRQNLGCLFLEFLYFYGFRLDYVCQAIIVHPPISGFDYKPYFSIYQLPNTMDHTPKLVIYDPLNPNNNVGRPTYRIECLQRLFRMLYLRLKSWALSISDILEPQFVELVHEQS